MWYFAWILGVSLAAMFGILNGMWHEFDMPLDEDEALEKH
jgi:cytochrome bd-I ubiquinol oxidase subunit X